MTSGNRGAAWSRDMHAVYQSANSAAPTQCPNKCNKRTESIWHFLSNHCRDEKVKGQRGCRTQWGVERGGAHLLSGGDRDLGEAGDGEPCGRLAEVHPLQLLTLLRERQEVPHLHACGPMPSDRRQTVCAAKQTACGRARATKFLSPGSVKGPGGRTGPFETFTM